MNMAERLRAWVVDDFGVELSALEPVAHGADAAAEVWLGTGAEGNRYAVKLSGGGSAASLVVSAHLVACGVPGVVGPLSTSSGELWSEREGRRLSLLPWVSDQRALDGGMTARHWKAYGALLGQMHATPVTEPLRRLPHEDHTHDRVVAVARDLDGRLEELARADDHLARELAKQWQAASGVVGSLLGHADDLGRELRGREAALVVCHGDPHLGNVLIGSEKQVWLIDWDDAILAPRERDLMFLIGGVLPFAQVSAEQQAWFFEGYGSDWASGLDPARLTYYQCTRALEDIVYFADEVADVHGRTDEQRADALDNIRGVLSSTGLATIALAEMSSRAAKPPRSLSTHDV